VRGVADVGEICQASVAVVGSRAATEYGVRSAADLGADLTLAGWTVVSGAAFGIDQAAHRGALAAGGSTMAVLACGADQVYPSSHTRLLERITAEGGRGERAATRRDADPSPVSQPQPADRRDDPWGDRRRGCPTIRCPEHRYLGGQARPPS